VFLRTSLVEADDVQKMIAVARALHPERLGALDLPAWDVGRRWCHPRTLLCPTCPLLRACPRLIQRGDVVKGV
jgi:endonuclease III